MKKIIISFGTLLFFFVLFFHLQTKVVTSGDTSIIVSNAKALADINPQMAASTFANCYRADDDCCLWTPYACGPCIVTPEYSEAGIAVCCED